MSNRTDFNAVARELIEMFRLDADTESDVGDQLLWRLERELHNAFVAGQELGATLTADEAEEIRRCVYVADGEGAIEESESQALRAAVDRVTTR